MGQSIKLLKINQKTKRIEMIECKSIDQANMSRFRIYNLKYYTIVLTKWISDLKNTWDDKVEQQSKGFANLAGSLRPLSSSSGNASPNLAPNPTNVSPSSPSIQFLTITWIIHVIKDTTLASLRSTSLPRHERIVGGIVKCT